MDNRIMKNMKIMKIDYDIKVVSFVFIISMLIAIVMTLVLVFSNNENKWYVFFLTLAIPVAYMFTKTKAFDYYIPPRKIYRSEVRNYDTVYDTTPSNYEIVQKNANRNDIKDSVVYTEDLNQIELDI